MTMDRGGANSAKGREILSRFLRDQNFRESVIANLREGRDGPGYTFDELSPEEREYLQSGQWRSVSPEQVTARTGDFTWQ